MESHLFHLGWGQRDIWGLNKKRSSLILTSMEFGIVLLRPGKENSLAVKTTGWYIDRESLLWKQPFSLIVCIRRLCFSVPLFFIFKIYLTNSICYYCFLNLIRQRQREGERKKEKTSCQVWDLICGQLCGHPVPLTNTPLASPQSHWFFKRTRDYSQTRG